MHLYIYIYEFVWGVNVYWIWPVLVGTKSYLRLNTASESVLPCYEIQPFLNYFPTHFTKVSVVEMIVSMICMSQSKHLLHSPCRRHIAAALWPYPDWSLVFREHYICQPMQGKDCSGTPFRLASFWERTSGMAFQHKNTPVYKWLFPRDWDSYVTWLYFWQ
jgi:hypothetical protein